MNNPTLLLIDVQKGFDEPYQSYWGSRNNPDAEQKIAELISTWREKYLPIIHIQHCSMEPNSPLRPSQPGNEFKKEAEPIAREKQFQKNVNSAFIGTDLEEYLRSCGITDLVIVGFTTDHCVSTTTRMAGNLGFNVTLVSDATVSFDRKGHDGKHYTAEEIHNIHLASLNGEFCMVKSTEEVME